MELEHGDQRFPLAGGEIVVGSDPAAAIVLADLRPRHAAIRPLGSRMATIRPLDEGAEIQVNGVNVGREPMPLLDGDRIRLGAHEIKVRNPAHPAGGPDSPPPGARQQLHDTMFGIPREPTPPGTPAVDQSSEPPFALPASRLPVRRSLGWVVAAAVLSLLLLLALLVF